MWLWMCEEVDGLRSGGRDMVFLWGFSVRTHIRLEGIQPKPDLLSRPADTLTKNYVKYWQPNATSQFSRRRSWDNRHSRTLALGVSDIECCTSC